MNLFWPILCACIQFIICFLLKSDSFNPVVATMVIFVMSVFACKCKFMANVLAVVLVVGMFLGFWGFLFGSITTFNCIVIGSYLVEKIDGVDSIPVAGFSRKKRRGCEEIVTVRYRSGGRMRCKKYKRIRSH